MKKTVKPYNRLRLGSEFAYVRRTGNKFVGRLMILVIAVPPDETLRLGVVCGRKFSNLAVERNRARRLIWESFRLLKTEIEPCHMVVIPRQAIAGTKQQQVQKEMEYLLKKATKLVRRQD